jgi:Fur family transcriptional regulator, ferric uptake regulator
VSTSEADAVLAQLRADGGRVTRSRRIVLEAMFELGDHHLTAADIVQGVRAVDPAFHESTVYRTLARLEELGVVTTLASSDRATTYHVGGHVHLHAICDACGAAQGLDVAVLAPVVEAVNDEHGFAVEPGRTVLRGRCRDCRTR